MNIVLIIYNYCVFKIKTINSIKKYKYIMINVLCIIIFLVNIILLNIQNYNMTVIEFCN